MPDPNCNDPCCIICGYGDPSPEEGGAIPLSDQELNGPEWAEERDLVT